MDEKELSGKVIGAAAILVVMWVRSGAVLDCAGHRITGADRTGQYGIYVRDGAGAVVRNCVAERFEVGIRVRGMQGGVLKKNVSQDNLRYGIEVTQGSTAIRIAKNRRTSA